MEAGIDFTGPVAAGEPSDATHFSGSQLLKALEVAVYTCDTMGCIRLYNNSAVSLWGKEPQAGKDSCFEFESLFTTTGEQVPARLNPVILVLKGEMQAKPDVLVLERPDGSRRVVEPHPELIMDAAGTVTGVVNMLVDITDKRLAEETRATLAAIVASSEDAIISKTLAGVIVSWNQGAQRLFGYTPEEMIGQPITRLIPEDRYNEEPEILSRLRRGERVEHFDTIRVTKSGELIDISLTISPVMDRKGRIIGASKIARNITIQKTLHKALQDSENKFRALIMQSPMAILILNGPDFLVEIVNDACLFIVARKRDDVLGKSILQVLPEVESQGIGELLTKIFTTGEPFYGNEFPLKLNRNGIIENVYFNFIYKPLVEPDGTIGRIMVVASDITEVVLSKYEVLESERQFSNMVMQSPIPMTIFRGKDHIIEIANTQMVKNIWRRDERDIIGKKALEVFPELRDQKYAELLHHVFTSGVMHREHESLAYIKGDDGMRKFYVDYEYLPLKGASGNISGIMITINDVTEKVEAKQKVEDAELRSRLAIEAAEMGTFDWNLLTNEFISSPRLNAIFGYKTDNMIGHQAMLKAFHPDDKPIRDKAVEESAQRGMLGYEARILHPDGRLCWIKVYGKIVYNNRKESQRMYGTVLDVTEEKTTLLALEESEQRLNVALQAAELGTWELDVNTENTIYSDKYLQLFGFTRQEKPRHEDILDRIYPEDLELRNKNIQLALSTGTLDFEMRLKSFRSKQQTWLQVKGMVFYDVNRVPLKIMGTIMDITDSKSRYRILQESEERFRTIANTVPVMIWMSGNDKFTDFFNTSWLNFTGRTAEQEKGEGWMESVHPDDRDSIIRNYHLSFVEQKKFYIEYRLRRYDGHYRWIGDSAVPRSNTSGNFIGFISACMDIHDQKEFSEAMVESEERFRLLANFMPQFVWTGDVNGVLNYFNQAVFDYSGMKPEDLFSEGWLQIVHPEDQEGNVIKWRHAVETGENFIYEHRFRRYDGTYRWQLSRALPQRDNTGTIQMWIGTSTDIQELKEHEQQKDDFIGMASHELKTPITSIKGYIQLLLQMTSLESNSMLKTSLTTIDKQVSRLTQLIRDLLDLTKINSGGFQLRKEIFCLQNLAEEVVNDIQHTSLSHRISLSYIDAANYNVYADRDRISQVLINFITNAIKYSPGADKVLVSIQSNSSEVTVAVEDLGIGISAYDQDKIFERFYRVQGKDELTFPGFGIGLFIANDIINRHEGRIWVQSEKNTGSIFYFSLPVNTQN